ncbi:hypothetical protein L7F22_004200 [Adiantum nelumboides]|nr:hypothetical protein [Adiantum nelumboides]
MKHYMEHTIPVPWSENRFGEAGSTRLPDMTECENASSPSSSYPLRVPNTRQPEFAPLNMQTPYPYQADAFMNSSMPPLIQETYGAMRGVPTWRPPTNFQEPFLPNQIQSFSQLKADVNSSLSHNFPSFSRNNGRDRSSFTQANVPQATPTWCQSYIHGPRSHSATEGTMTDTGNSGEQAHDEADRKNAAHNVQFHGSNGDSLVDPSQVMQTEVQQVQQQIQGGQPVFVPMFGTHTGVAQPQGAAAVVAGTARPRVRARRGQATDPHSIAERLRRERIAERMKALQELVPNANKTDKASMLDEIIDYVKFLQLQVKVLSMSRLGGAGAVAPLIADFPAEGQNSHPASLSSNVFQDGMVVAERQVARLMEEDMGSAMQFLQAKGLCLMPVSLASVISTNNSRMPVGGSGQPLVLSVVDQSRVHAASSTSSTLASVASSGCIGGEGDSKSKQ